MLPGDRLVEKVAHRTAPNHNFLAAQRARLLRERFPNRRRGTAVDAIYNPFHLTSSRDLPIFADAERTESHQIPIATLLT